MKKSIIVVIVLIVLVAGGVVAAMQLGKDSDSSMTNTSGMDMADKDSSSMMSAEQDLTAQKEVTMNIQDFDFEKANIKIKVGTKVTWTNMDSARHNVVTDGDGVEKLSSELLAKGESYNFTFTKAGTTNYLCEPHPYMKAKINVVE